MLEHFGMTHCCIHRNIFRHPCLTEDQVSLTLTTQTVGQYI